MHRFKGTRAASVYALVDPREPEHVRYVGLTVLTIELRRDGHVKQALRERDDWHKSQWIRKLQREGVTPDVICLATGNWAVDEMCAIEVAQITQYLAAGHKLTNMTKGGESTLGLPPDRRPTGDRSGQRRYPLSVQAQNNGRAKLTYEDGASIVSEYQDGATYKALAEKYSVSPGTIRNVVKGLSPWTKSPVADHVPVSRSDLTKEEANRKRSESLKRSWDDPDVRARRVAGLRRAWSDPERRAQQSERLKLSWRNQHS